MLDVRFSPLTASGVVIKGSGYVYAVIDGGHTANATATLYDEIAAITGREILTFRTLANDTVELTFNPPIFVQRGLYVTMGVASRSMLVVWLPMIDVEIFDYGKVNE